MATENEIRLGIRRESLVRLLIKGMIALSVLWVVLFMLPGCDGEFERLQAEAAWNAKVARAATPKKGELVTIRELGGDRLIVRRYNGGLQSTDIISKEEGVY